MSERKAEHNHWRWGNLAREKPGGGTLGRALELALEDGDDRAVGLLAGRIFVMREVYRESIGY